MILASGMLSSVWCNLLSSGRFCVGHGHVRHVAGS